MTSEVIFVDGSLPDAAGLANRLAASAPSDVSIAIRLLDSSRDGFEQVAERDGIGFVGGVGCARTTSRSGARAVPVAFGAALGERAPVGAGLGDVDVLDDEAGGLEGAAQLRR